MTQVGWGLTVVAALFFLADGLFVLFGRRFAPRAWHALMDEGGFPTEQAPFIGMASLAAGVLYAFPATAVLGAILLTAYLGGAICTYVRLGRLAAPPQIVSLVLGVVVWGALFLRDPRIRVLLPFDS